MGGDKFVRLEMLRGLAAAAVVAQHVLLTFWPEAVLAADVFPLVRVLYAGSFAVQVFFVLSGFVLSISFFRSRDVTVVIAAAVRRYFRLVLPVASSVLLAYGLLRAGLMYNAACADAQGQAPGAWLRWPYQFAPSLRAALSEGFFGAFFAYDPRVTYNTALWTMSIELKGSFLLFAFLALFGALPRRAVAYMVGALVLYGTNSSMLYFLIGICLCDIFIARGDAKPWPTPVCVALVLVGLVLGGLSPRWARAHGLGWMLSAAWGTVGALLVVAGTAAAPRRASTGGYGALRLLGRVSFSLYLLHLPLLFSLGCGTYLLLLSGAGWSHLPAAAVATTVFVGLTVALSWVAAVSVEDFSIWIGRRLSDHLVQPAGGTRNYRTATVDDRAAAEAPIVS